MASTDLTTLVVAIAGVAGTMGSPWLSQRARRAELREQADRESRVREEDRIDRAFEHKRTLYANLNRAARIYRSTARDVALIWAVPWPRLLPSSVVCRRLLLIACHLLSADVGHRGRELFREDMTLAEWLDRYLDESLRSPNALQHPETIKI